MAHLRLNALTRTTLVLFAILSATACYTWKVEPLTPANVLATRRPQQLRVERTDGSQLVLNHPALLADTLSGTVKQATDSHHVTISLADVRHAATRRFSSANTLVLAVGLVGVAYIGYGVLYWLECAGGRCD